MWPFFKGEMLEKLRQNDDLLLDLQAHLGITLAILTPLLFLSFAGLIVMGPRPWLITLLVLQTLVWIWAAHGSFLTIRWRDELQARPAAAEDATPHHPRLLALQMRRAAKARAAAEPAAM